MSKIQLKEVNESRARVNFHVNLDSRASRGYETDVAIKKTDEGWIAEIHIGSDMPHQETPEEAVDRLCIYLKKLSTAVKGKNIKHLNIDGLFKPVHK